MVSKDRYEKVNCDWEEEEPKAERGKTIYSAYKKFATVVCAGLHMCAEFALGA